jgi:hypothetical protein
MRCLCDRILIAQGRERADAHCFLKARRDTSSTFQKLQKHCWPGHLHHPHPSHSLTTAFFYFFKLFWPNKIDYFSDSCPWTRRGNLFRIRSTSSVWTSHVLCVLDFLLCQLVPPTFGPFVLLEVNQLESESAKWVNSSFWSRGHHLQLNHLLFCGRNTVLNLDRKWWPRLVLA